MSIYKKLFEAKKEIGTITKDSKNPFFKSNYLSLNGLIDAVEEVLVNHELLLLQPIENATVTTRIVEIGTGVSVDSCIDLPTINDPQKLGSAITYYRRYTLQSLLGLQAEDDDANVASKATSNEPELPWLNEKDIEKVITQALPKGLKTNDLRKYYKISKKVALLLDAKLI